MSIQFNQRPINMSIDFGNLKLDTQSALLTGAERLKTFNEFYFQDENTSDGKVIIQRSIERGINTLCFSIERLNLQKLVVVFGDNDVVEHLHKLLPLHRRQFNITGMKVHNSIHFPMFTVCADVGLVKGKFIPLSDRDSKGIREAIRDMGTARHASPFNDNAYTVYIDTDPKNKVSDPKKKNKTVNAFKLHLVREGFIVTASFVLKVDGVWDERRLEFPFPPPMRYSIISRPVQALFEQGAGAGGAGVGGAGGAGAGAGGAGGDGAGAGGAGGDGAGAGGAGGGILNDSVDFCDAVFSPGDRISILETIRRMELSSSAWYWRMPLEDGTNEIVFTKTISTHCQSYALNVVLMRGDEPIQVNIDIESKDTITTLPCVIATHAKVYCFTLRSSVRDIRPHVYYSVSADNRKVFVEVMDQKLVDAVVNHVEIACQQNKGTQAYRMVEFFDAWFIFSECRGDSLNISIATKNGDDERILCCSFPSPVGFKVHAVHVARTVLKKKQMQWVGDVAGDYVAGARAAGGVAAGAGAAGGVAAGAGAAGGVGGVAADAVVEAVAQPLNRYSAAMMRLQNTSAFSAALFSNIVRVEAVPIPASAPVVAAVAAPIPDPVPVIPVVAVAAAPIPVVAAAAPPAPGPAGGDIIDLTLSDDDEPAQPAKRSKRTV